MHGPGSCVRLSRFICLRRRARVLHFSQETLTPRWLSACPFAARRTTLEGALSMGDIAGWAVIIGLLLMLALAIASLWLWGGVGRGALGHLLAGALLLVSGAAFVYVPLINAFARMDNAYLGNGILGLFLVLLGVALLIGSLAGYGVSAWLAVLLWLATVTFGIFGVSWLASVTPNPSSAILIFAALVLGGPLLYITVRGYLTEAGTTLALVAAGFALVWWIDGGSLRDFTPVTRIDGPLYKPPVLDIEQFLSCLLIATVLFFVGRFLQPRLRGQRHSTISAFASLP
jgi:hypothetical protein